MSVLTDLENKNVSPWGNQANALVNPNTQASVAGTNTFTYPRTVVSGTEAMVTITVPYPSFQGRITLYPTAAFTGTNAGNIAIAFTAVVGRALDLDYNPYTAKWYPSYA